MSLAGAHVVTVTLSDLQLQRLAELVAERLAVAPQSTLGRKASRRSPTPERAHSEASLVDATELARRLGVSRSTVYAHKAALGARELGAGERPRLRFDLAQALNAWTACIAGRGSQDAKSGSSKPIPRYRRARANGSGVPLLPIGGSAGPEEGGGAVCGS